MLPSITAPDLAAWLADPQREPPQLLDVREPWEHGVCHIPDSMLVPMATVPHALDRLDPERPVVCICHHGGRSSQVAMFLMRQGLQQVFNLTGGVDAWARQVDRNMPTY